jgi:hypothetical protein
MQMNVGLDDVIKLLNQRNAVLSVSRAKEPTDV